MYILSHSEPTTRTLNISILWLLFFPLKVGENYLKRKILIHRTCLISLFLTHQNWMMTNRSFRNILYRDEKPLRDGANV